MSKSILDHPNFVNCLKIRTQEWLKTNSKLEWQYHVASDKKLLYPHSSFAVALQAYVRTIVRRPIAKILCSLERLGVTKTFLIHDLTESQLSSQNEQFLKFWKDMFMDNIIGDIKGLIRQQKIPSDKIPLIMDVAPTNAPQKKHHNIYSLSYDKASELLSSLEILLCFVKRTSVGSEETKILDYVNQWMKLSVLLKSKSFENLLNAGLCLKHLVDLYELIEEQIANSVINYVDDKFKIELTKEVKDEIDSAVEFERSLMIKQRIPAELFAIALKRFMLRFLKDFKKDQLQLKYYIIDEGLNLWPADISDELLEIFPESLLVCHIYEAYVYVNSNIKLEI